MVELLQVLLGLALVALAYLGWTNKRLTKQAKDGILKPLVDAVEERRKKVQDATKEYEDAKRRHRDYSPYSDNEPKG